MIQLHYRQYNAKLELNTQRPFLQLETVKPQIELRTQTARLEVRPPRGTLYIDQSPCRESLGILDNMGLAREGARLGKATAMEAIARKVREGEQLARIESRQDPIVAMAKQAMEKEEKTVVLGPLARPILRYEVEPAQMEFQPAKLDLTLHRGKVMPTFQPWRVEGKMVQYPSIKFWTTGDLIDRYA